jgi:hypothetical protein
MRKSTFILSAVVGLFAYPAFGQTITFSGTNATINPGSGSTATSTISVTVTGTNSIADLKSLNDLIATPSTGPNSGVSLFSVFVLSLSSPYDNKNSGSSSSMQSTFTTAGDASNSGHTVSSTPLDLGANTSGTAPTIASSGTTTIQIDTLEFTSLAALTPGTVYDFFVTSGGHADSNQGSWIDNTANATFDPTSTPIFTITVVPEPATLSLFGLGTLGAFGLNLLRGRRKT